MGLSPAQVEHFVAHSWVKLEAAVPAAMCARWVTAACKAHGVDPAEPSTWGDPHDSWRPQKFLDIRHELSVPMRDAAPRLHAAIWYEYCVCVCVFVCVRACVCVCVCV